jgi:hypothetical protein
MTKAEIERADVIHKLQQFSVEVLEAALMILQMREQKTAKEPPSGT